MKTNFKAARQGIVDPRNGNQVETGYLEKGTINGAVYNIAEVIKDVDHRLREIESALGDTSGKEDGDSARKEDPKPYSVLDGLAQIESRLYHVSDYLAKIERHIGGKFMPTTGEVR